MDHVGALHFRKGTLPNQSARRPLASHWRDVAAPLEWLYADDSQRLNRVESLSIGLVNCAKVAGAHPVVELAVISFIVNLLDEFCVCRIFDKGALLLVVSKSNASFMSTANIGSRRGDSPLTPLLFLESLLSSLL